MRKSFFLILPIVLMLFGCFTGIENTGRISEKDVAKVKADKQSAEALYLDSVRPDSFQQWRPGKQFFVSDDNIRLIFDPINGIDSETLSLKGDTLIYQGYKFRKNLNNTEDVVINFSDGVNTYSYDTGKPIEEVETQKPEYVVPFVIDLDYINKVQSKLKDKTLYIKSPLWFEEDLRKLNGVKFVPVTIKYVKPGDLIYPFHVFFEYKNRIYGVSMSSQVSSIKNTTFDKLFSFNDIRKNYGTISDDNWVLITKGRVAVGMTKEECSLSLGTPKTIDRSPTHGGLYERWSYDNGTYLMFDNGLLLQYRR